MSYDISAISGISGTAAPMGVSGASRPMPPQLKMLSLFDKIDSTGSGSITKSELQQAFSTQKPPRGFQKLGADALWQQLDPNGSGSVSQSQFVQTMTSLMSQMRTAHHNNLSQSASATVDQSTQALNLSA